MAQWVGRCPGCGAWGTVVARDLAATHPVSDRTPAPPIGWDISSTVVGDIGKVLPVVPRLRSLYVRGNQIEIDKLEHARLQSVTIKTGGLPGTSARAVGNCKLPEATSLVVYFGAENYGAGGSISSIRALFKGDGVPKLKHLGLCNAEFQDEIARELAKSPLLSRLTSVDLSLGTMTDAGARHILKAAKKFAHLERIDLSDNFISDAVCAELEAALPQVETSGQDEASEYDGRQYYYVSVGE